MISWEKTDIFDPSPVRKRERFAQAYTVLEQAIARHAFPGCAFGVMRQGQVLLNDALGAFTYEDAAPAVVPGTIYDIASLTKVVCTTAVAMLLYERGQLDLDTTLGELLPGFVVGRDDSRWARAVMIRHLLAHSSGLPGYVPLFQRATNARAVLRGCLELPIEAEPGTHAVYSDPGFILLGKALEMILDEPLGAWAGREIFRPLRMDATGFSPLARVRPQIPPTEEDQLFRLRRIQGEVQDEHAFLLRGAAGHAGLFSNVTDLLRFSAEILEPQLFRASTVALFARRQPPPGSSRALGWDTPSGESSSGAMFSPDSIGHLGYSGCSLWIDREAAVTVVLLTNRTWPHRESQLIREIRPAFHDAVRLELI